MQITDILSQEGGLQCMARELGITESQAAAGAAALTPAILDGFKKQVQSQPFRHRIAGRIVRQVRGRRVAR